MFSYSINKLKDFLSKNCNSKNRYTCDFIRNGLIFSQDGIIKVCANNKELLNDDCILTRDFNGIWFDEQNIIKKITYLNKKYEEEMPSQCLNCAYIIPKPKQEKKKTFNFIILDYWKCCFLNCKYCYNEKIDDIAKTNHFEIFPVIQQLLDSELIDKNTKIIFNCGDATLHPDFDKLMYFFINYEFKNIQLYTSALRYCHSISEALAKNILKVYVSFDSGCPYIYEKIKGVNKFDLAISNIKRYLDYQGKFKKNFIMCYTLVEGINDNQKEILDWFLLFQGLGIESFTLDIDEKWYKNSRLCIPTNLKNLILYFEEMSKLNNINWEYSSKVLYLYKKIKNES